MQQRIFSLLSGAFGDMPESAAREMLPMMRLRTCRKGTHLFRQGEEPRCVYFVEAGLVKWHKLTHDGNEQTLQLAGPGDAVGLVALAILRRLGNAVRWLVEHVHCVSSRSAQERVVSVLMQKAQPTDTGTVIALTHQEIAQLGGMARETASRVLAELQRRGAVRLTRNAVLLVDPNLLWEQPSRTRFG